MGWHIRVQKEVNMNSNERRQVKRDQLDTRLIIKRLDGGLRQDVAIEVNNLSKSGIGFCSTELMQIGNVYEGNLTIWTKEVIHVFIEIVRIEKKEDTFEYGAIFIGMAEMDLARIATYQTVNDMNN